ncbi:MAG: hypothetical protein ACO3WU_11720, partial [Ilumatobacteraceae bacterium]
VRIIANPDSPTYLQVFVPTVQVVNENATFDACALDSDVQVDVATGETVSDLVVAGIVTYRLDRVESRWRVREFEIVQRLEGVGECG